MIRKRPLFLFLFIFCLVILLACGIIYLNKVYLPVKIRSLIIQGIQSYTGKKASLDSVQFSFFKGLVLSDLTLYDKDEAILSLKKGSCVFLFWPFFKKQLVIPSVKLEAVNILLERRADKRFNWQEIFSQAAQKPGKGNLGVLIYKIQISNSQITYRDLALKPAFQESLNDLDISLSLALPASVKFRLKGQIPAKQRIKISAQGEYKLANQEGSIKFSLSDIAARELSGYYQGLPVEVKGGIINTTGELNFQGHSLNAQLTLRAKEFLLSQQEIAFRLNSEIQTKLDYSLEGRQFSYSGNAKISDAEISGIASIGEVKGITGMVSFDNTKAEGNKLNARVLDLPIQADLRVVRFNEPQIVMEVRAEPPLARLKDILKEKFSTDLPILINGSSRLAAHLEFAPLSDTLPVLNGYFELADASVKLQAVEPPLEGLNGRLNFTLTGLSWEGAHFNFLNKTYRTNGALANFQRPAIELSIDGDNLKLRSSILVDGKLLSIAKFSADYLNSALNFSGDINIGEVNNPDARISGDARIELADLPEIMPRLKEQFVRIGPKGKVKTRFNLSGDLADIASCSIEGQATSDTFSVYGLRAADLLAGFKLENKLLEITPGRLALYDGAIDLRAKVNFASANLPCWLDFTANGIKIEKLKLDTPVKDKDISGIIQAQGKVNSFLQDFLKISGSGKVVVSEGKLWELNLFQGLGKLIFTQDLANIVVSEASFPFVIQDKAVTTDNLKMLSNIAEIGGSVKIGLDGSLNAQLSVNMLEGAPANAAGIKDIASAILGTAGKFGTIVVSGTLKDPKYSFKPAVADIFNGIKNAIFGN